MHGYRLIMVAVLLCAVASASTVVAQSCPGCINCVNTGGGVWKCNLTQSNGGTSCMTTTGGVSCATTGDCVVLTPPSGPGTGALVEEPSSSKDFSDTYHLDLKDGAILQIADRDPQIASALIFLRQMGPIQFPVRIYQNPLTRDEVAMQLRGEPAPHRAFDPQTWKAIVFRIKVQRDPEQGDLLLSVQRVNGPTKGAYSRLTINVSPAWEAENQWLLMANSWSLEK